MAPPRLRRHRALIVWWEGAQPVFHNYLKKRTIRPEARTFEFLDFFSEWRGPEDVAQAFPTLDRRILARAVNRLHASALLEAEDEPAPPEAGILQWEWGLPVKLFHMAVRNLDYASNFQQQLLLYQERLAKAPQPSLFKNLDDAPHIPLPRELTANHTPLDVALLERTTCRQWLRQPISLDALARLLYMTWGVTGCHVDTVTGPLLHKTSPSGGSRHPTEVYPVVLNVEGVPPGIYHYSVEHHRLERVRAGHFGALISWIAAGQDWLANAAVICVMTSRVERVMWKYPTDRAYRVMTLDLAHLCQTFYLLSTAMGLGPFTTGAFRDVRLERELGLDSAWEPAMYLCAAGVRDPSAYTSLEPCVRRGEDGRLHLDDHLWKPPADAGPAIEME
ncbi:MAG: SagB/ThcOx family dehydrogenase [Armatimonadetes bacterium]|nr:SagB/ThcOx family dehydrogenase [Armatimonadota bacterium]